ncbi:hypothetical protein NKDENANG_00072 [Candidatus Entotheonellaceae bacterium PAL068K]
MDIQTVVANALGINANFIQMALDGLSDEDLMKQPNDQCNPIGWTLWHQTRIEDAILSNIGGKPQAWVDGGWHSKFGMDADPGRSGMGDSMEQVMALKPSVEALKDYMGAVREKTLETLKSLSPEDLERELPAPDGGTRKAGDYLGILMLDHFHHSGQVCYLRGYLTGKGWFRS